MNDVIVFNLTKFLFMALMLCVPAVVLLLPVYWRWRERGRLLDMARTAMEKGAQIPPEILQVLPQRAPLPSADRDLRRGVILIAAGVALGLLGAAAAYVGKVFLTAPDGAYSEQGVAFGVAVGALAAVPICIGLALILLSRLARTSREP